MSAPRISFDPSEVKVQRGRVWFPRLGWMKADVLPIPRDAKLVAISVIPNSDGTAEIEMTVEPREPPAAAAEAG